MYQFLVDFMSANQVIMIGMLVAFVLTFLCLRFPFSSEGPGKRICDQWCTFKRKDPWCRTDPDSGIYSCNTIGAAC